MKLDTRQPPAQEGEHDDETADRRSDVLMPLEAVAKAIFVKANGLPAYQAATGLGKRSEDEKASE